MATDANTAATPPTPPNAAVAKAEAGIAKALSEYEQSVGAADAELATGNIDQKARDKKVKKAAKNRDKSLKFHKKKLAQAKGGKPAFGGGKKGKKTKGKKEAPTKNTKFVNKVPKGQKKDCSGGLASMPDKYEPNVVEASWQDWWEASGFYKPSVETAKAAAHEDKFVIVIPPPNVTGTLHLGHALTCSIQDTVCRWHRMHGRQVMWVPGTDHAGIATQTVVEKKLFAESKITRHDLGREAFLKKVWEWKEKNGNFITQQLRRLGSSVDWSRERFTMDPMLNKAVREAFVRMFDKGIIYRENRLVNWCCKLNTAISQIEVDQMELAGRKRMKVPGHTKYGDKYLFGTLTSFKYPVELDQGSAEAKNGDAGAAVEYITVATTRLETMLGDTAVCIHPEDERYTHLHGKFVIHPFNGKRLPIIQDAELVDMAFGTGCVKITPAHDENDFECGKRHQLPMVNIFNDDGTINENGGSAFEGMMRFDARVAVKEALKDKGLYVREENNKMILPICSRSGDVIEPRLKPQWYVNCNDMAARAVAAVETATGNDKLTIMPAEHEQTWYRWLKEIRPWCISRQLWWGHRVPAYRVVVQDAAGAFEDKQENWVAARTPEEAMERAMAKTGLSADKLSVEQDEDVLDTWFSSGLFPFSVFGWPDKTDDLEAFFPTHLLETGHDILFFWVARMVMMSLELMDCLPFNTVFLHAMVRDAKGRKMSKSKGNVIDPLECIDGCTLKDLHEKLYASQRMGKLSANEVKFAVKDQKDSFPRGIPECGTDALRFTLTAYTQQGKNVNLDIDRVVGYRQFCNKVWQGCRFAMRGMGAGEGKGADKPYQPVATSSLLDLPTREGASDMDKWVLSQLNTTIMNVNRGMKMYNFGDVTHAIHSFWVSTFCNTYLETTKPIIYGAACPTQEITRQVLQICLEYGLLLLHPFMPFLTEECWQRMPWRGLSSTTTGESKTEEQPTIMLTEFPTKVQQWACPAVDAKMAIAQQVVESMRSIRGEYEVGHKDKTQTQVYTNDAATKDALETFRQEITLLGGCAALEVREPDARKEQFCAVKVVNAQVSVHTVLKGLLDVKKELAKLAKQLAQEDKTIGGLQKQLQNANVPAARKAECQVKVEQALQRKVQLEASVKRFEAMADTSCTNGK